MNQKQAAAILFAVVLLGAAAFIIYRNYTKPPDRIDPRPVRCAACDHLFIPRSVDEMNACPKCSSPDLVTVYWFTCRRCAKTFIGYEADPKTGHFRFPDGEWTAPNEFEPIAVCPGCESKAASSTTDAAAIRSAIDAMQ